MELEQLRIFTALCEAGGFSAAARRLYKSHSSVSRAVSALERELGVTLCERDRTRFALTAAGERLYAGALELLKKGDISGGHARALLGLDDEAQIVDLAQKIVQKDYSVRETERIVRLFKANAEKGDEPEVLDESDAQRKVYMKDLERRVMRTLGRKVRIARVAKKKIVELSYEDDQDLEEIIKRLCGDDFFAEI